tara:strand:- start:926 stop:1057 length:132 start_codon:yes stop_codon:yes gene_type:complete
MMASTFFLQMIGIAPDLQPNSDTLLSPWLGMIVKSDVFEYVWS